MTRARVVFAAVVALFSTRPQGAAALPAPIERAAEQDELSPPVVFRIRQAFERFARALSGSG